jgi:hypothetical protein
VCSNQRRDSSSDKVPIALAFSGAAPAQQNKTNLKLKAYLLKLEVANKPYPSKQTRKENPLSLHLIDIQPAHLVARFRSALDKMPSGIHMHKIHYNRLSSTL